MNKFDIDFYFEAVSNDDFVAYFLQDLHCRMELTQYLYPHEPIESETDAIDEHIKKCYSILMDYIRQCINEAVYEKGLILKVDKINYIYDKKKEELFALITPLANKYFEDVKVTYIQL